jgi:hypothetical protein
VRFSHAAKAAILISCVALLGGCSASSPPVISSSPHEPLLPKTDANIPPAIVSGAADSVAPRPGSPGALYRYRFRQVSPSSDRFTFQDRELSFYFRPTPAALFMQVENRQDRPTWIDWERSTFEGPLGHNGKVAHATTRFPDRFRAQPNTQIPGLQRYSDYLFPIDNLVESANPDEQLHRPLLPEDHAAPQYQDRQFAVNLTFLIEGQPRTYYFRYEIASVLPR